MKITAKLWIGLALLVALCPIGLLLPRYFKSGEAWGEWSGDQMKELVGYVPRGLAKLSSLWSAPLPDYGFRGWQEESLARGGFAYIVSAFVGIAACVGVVFVLGKLLIKKK